MNGAIWSAVGAAFGALCGLLGVWLVQRNDRRKASTDGVQRFIDQIQEQLSDATRRIEKCEVRERLLLDYVAVLRAHIDQRSDPPPPPFPAALRGG